MGLLDKFKKAENRTADYFFKTDLHSHLIPGVDDGVKSWDEAKQILQQLHEWGVENIVTTPHIKSDIFPNEEEKLISYFNELKAVAVQTYPQMKVAIAAEYYLDETFIEKLNKNKSILTFGDNYVLFETSHSIESPFFTEIVFEMRNRGYKPILAHPERYAYCFGHKSKLEKMYGTDVFFQLNINSLSGYYGEQPQKMAEWLIEQKMVDFVGTDCHGVRHLPHLEKGLASKSYQKLLSLPILNHSIFDNRSV